MGPPPYTSAAGILICEGEELDVAEFVQRLRALRWKAMAVRLELLQSGLDAHSKGRGRYCNTHAACRCEQQIPVPEGAQLRDNLCIKHEGIIELDEGGMSELSLACLEAGLEDMFLTALKIQK